MGWDTPAEGRALTASSVPQPVQRGGVLRVHLTNRLPPDTTGGQGLLAMLARAVQRVTRLTYTSKGEKG